MKPLLSIIIPTRNRYKYLEKCLESVLATYNNQNVEIIITDNSSPREEIKILNQFSNINYSFIENPISQVENFELALENVTGEYVTMIGDDDGLSGLLLEVVDYMKRNNVDALNSPFATYYWPDIVSKNKVNSFSGKMFLSNYSYKISELSASLEISKCLSLGGTSLCNLPRMYYGIIRKDVLEAVKARTGFYFPGPSPDMANAFSAALFTKKLVHFDAPLFIAGNSAKSAAGMGLAGKHVGAIMGNPQLPQDCHLNWSMLIPKYWSGPTIWAESVIKVIDNSNRLDLYDKFNFIRLYASCLVFNSEYNEIIYKTIERYKLKFGIRRFSLLLELQKLNIWKLRFRSLFLNIIKNKINKSFTKNGIVDILEASKIIEVYENKIRQMTQNENI